ncbi:uncharacterized protein N7511_011353 [Penicillium nucicola]|uniref:uncharacterized protein n=1 Tax=Penicillium nucicola TaxID=1850975 RepID=UPI002545790B|nr:uncharacterized protein N7511_011353 [Penicillium nucicola]KAJ5742621.1 hypothetical protein N7511_011353 [Penicillium nucicola]
MRQYAAARENGHPPSDLVITGGFARNSWAITYLESEVQKSMPGIKCTTEVVVETVAQGALRYARNPLKETTTARVDVGLSYLEDRTPSGRPLGGDRVEDAIGWVILKGEAAGTESRVVLIKTVFRDKQERSNKFISSKVWTTTDRFDQKKIQPNSWNDWDCPITYPIIGLRSDLNCIGIIEAKIPQDTLFPAGSKHAQVEARFLFTVRPKDQLLEATVFLMRDNYTPLLLEKSYVSAPAWVPQSEFDVDGDRHDSRQSPFLTSEPLTISATGKVQKRRKRAPKGESTDSVLPPRSSIEEIPLPRSRRKIRRLGPLKPRRSLSL